MLSSVQIFISCTPGGLMANLACNSHSVLDGIAWRPRSGTALTDYRLTCHSATSLQVGSGLTVSRLLTRKCRMHGRPHLCVLHSDQARIVTDDGITIKQQALTILVILEWGHSSQ
jgi:hypothetical protein